MRHQVQFSSWKEHWVGRGNEEDGFVPAKAGIAYFSLTSHEEFDRLIPFGIVSGGNRRVVVLMSRERAWSMGRPARVEPVVAISRDGGETFPASFPIPGLSGRPVSLAKYSDHHYVMKCVSHQEGSARVVRAQSFDGGETWPERAEEAPSPLTGRVMASEGGPLVVQTEGGPTLYEVVCDSTGHPVQPSVCCIRRYLPNGSMIDAPAPASWSWAESDSGVSYARSVDEGSLAFAKNGSIIAALRTNMQPRYFSGVHDDSLEGLAVSCISADWQNAGPLTTLYAAGRHHAHLLPLPNGELLLTNIVRADIRKGELASFRRGCEAMVSVNGGTAFCPDDKYVLEGFNYLEGKGNWVNGMCGHCASALSGRHILTVYGNYINQGATIIRWEAEQGRRPG